MKVQNIGIVKSKNSSYSFNFKKESTIQPKCTNSVYQQNIVNPSILAGIRFSANIEDYKKEINRTLNLKSPILEIANEVDSRKSKKLQEFPNILNEAGENLMDAYACRDEIMSSYKLFQILGKSEFKEKQNKYSMYKVEYDAREITEITSANENSKTNYVAYLENGQLKTCKTPTKTYKFDNNSIIVEEKDKYYANMDGINCKGIYIYKNGKLTMCEKNVKLQNNNGKKTIHSDAVYRFNGNELIMLSLNLNKRIVNNRIVEDSDATIRFTPYDIFSIITKIPEDDNKIAMINCNGDKIESFCLGYNAENNSADTCYFSIGDNEYVGIKQKMLSDKNGIYFEHCAKIENDVPIKIYDECLYANGQLRIKSKKS